MRIYKAKVVKINPPSDDGKRRRQILIAPKNQNGAGPYAVSATPPSWIPTSVIGSGVVSYPEVGQECLVAEEHGERHIITYTNPPNVSPYGQLTPREVTEGGFSLQIMGLNPSIFEMNRDGGIFMSGSPFAQIKIKGDEKSISKRVKTFENRYAGGIESLEFAENGSVNPKKAKNTKYKAVFGSHDENPGFWDANLNTEEVNTANAAAPKPGYAYSDKSVVTAGHHEDNTVYNLDSRQSVNTDPTSKNVVTKLRVGYQQDHNRWGQEVEYPGGTMLEWTAKKNIAGNVGSFMLRYGKLSKNYQNQGVSGEIYRIQAVEGLNNNTPFGNTTTDPVGRGKGYEFSKKHNAAQQFTQSFGYLDQINDSEQKGSVYRQFIRQKNSRTEIWSKNLLGGENGDLIWRKDVGKDKISLNQQLLASKGGIYELKYSQDDQEEVISIENKKITLKSSEDVSITIDGKKIELKMKNSTLTLDPQGLYYNGQPLVFESLITWLSENKSNLGIDSMGAPVSMFPKALGEFESKKKLSHTGEPRGFTTSQ